MVPAHVNHSNCSIIPLLRQRWDWHTLTCLSNLDWIVQLLYSLGVQPCNSR